MHEIIRSAGLTPPYISVVIPVYNVEPWLRRALDSVVYQTLQEIEIIVVNDCSPDNSQAIIDEYAARFPNMIVPVMHEKNKGLALARQTGFLRARAPYLMFLDSDDFLDSCACETALVELLRGKHEMVGMNATRWDDDGNNLEWFSAPADTSTGALIRSAPAAFWNYLYARRLLEGEGVFEPIYFEDAATTPAIIAKAKSVGWIPKKYQLFYAMRSGSIMASFTNSKKKSDYFKADTLLWAKAKDPYKADFAWRIAKRLGAALHKYPELYAEGVVHAQTLYPQLKPYLDERFPRELRANLERAMQLPAAPVVPLTMYLNGFCAEKRDLAPLRASGVAERVVVLDESSCDVAGAPAGIRQALAEGRHEEAAVWFAMQAIDAQGGFYAAPGAHPTHGVGAVRFHEVFLSAGDKQTVSLHFFGGKAHQPWWQRLMDCLAEDAGTPAGEKLAALLLTEGGVHLLGDDEEGIGGLHVIPRLACQLRSPACCCYLDYAGLPAPEGVMVVPAGVLELALAHTEQNDTELVEKLRKQRDSAHRARDEYMQQMLTYYRRTPRGFLGRAKRFLLRTLKK